MTTEELTKLKNDLREVTSGPWKSYVEGRDHTSGSGFVMTGDSNYDIDFTGIRVVDQDFIAAARNAMPYLIDEVLRLRAILSQHKISF
ncbi:MAG TPA: hypothetical protein VHM26_04415 [Chitinophagaceae bacterium]|jgi:hypothetical protein|nr:hypothetical protein [Chitinophagaceae bacterium]